LALSHGPLAAYRATPFKRASRSAWLARLYPDCDGDAGTVEIVIIHANGGAGLDTLLNGEIAIQLIGVATPDGFVAMV
jgi:hypothetical protein